MSIEFARALSATLHTFLLYIFAQEDSIIREQLPDYGKTFGSGGRTRAGSRVENNSNNIFELENTSPNSPTQSSSVTGLSSYRGSTRRGSQYPPAHLCDARVEYLVNKFLELAAFLQANPGSWYFLEEMIDTVPKLCEAFLPNSTPTTEMRKKCRFDLKK